jgi:hypothetical protein
LKLRRFHLKTIDNMTLRLMMGSCRPVVGGDAFFVVKYLFRDDDGVVVPANATTTTKRIDKNGYLIQLNTTTTETISLQGVCVCDVTDPLEKTDGFPITPDHGKREVEQNDETAFDDLDVWTISSALVLQEQITDGTGRRMLSIHPTKYKKVLVARMHR